MIGMGARSAHTGVDVQKKFNKMVVVNAGRNFEVFARRNDQGHQEFYTHVHCSCGSTFGSAEFMTTISEGIALALESIENHESRFSCGVQKVG